ncbi:hypothetical protein, partial [Brevibacillus invocatus]|uniref:hypothetical protein n=1 Tax=Brevibacillus invocatus TaxID=173959 RepID=UPI0039EE3078
MPVEAPCQAVTVNSIPHPKTKSYEKVRIREYVSKPRGLIRFVITNYHVVQSVPEEGLPKNIVVPIVNHGTSKARFTRYALDKRSDLAAFEIMEEDIDRFDPKRFITEDYAQINPVEYLRDQNNMVLLHGCPSDMSGIDYNDQVVQVTTFPYVTFAIGYQEESNIIQVSAHSEGLNEHGQIAV